MSAPTASAVRSIDWAVTSRPARTFICWRPRSKGLLACHSLHATHAGREVRVFYVQGLVGGKLTLMAAVTQIPRTVHPRPAHHREHGPGAELPVLRPMTTGTRQLTLLRRRRCE